MPHLIQSLGGSLAEHLAKLASLVLCELVGELLVSEESTFNRSLEVSAHTHGLCW